MSNTWRPRDVAGVLLIVGAITMAYHKKESQTAAPEAPQYKMGEILLPDYAHSDTLIVVNAPALNREIVNAETDGEINEVLHKHCAVTGKSVK